MDPKNDIREQLDPYGKEAYRVLQLQQPETTPATDVGWDTNGLDCLVAVIRRIYAFMPKAFLNDGTFTAVEKQNPILRYAWQMLDAQEVATDATRAQQAAEKKAVMAKLFPGDAEPATSFWHLIVSSLMLDTFWSRPEFQLFRPRLQKREGDPVWRPVPWPARQLDYQSLIHLDRIDNPEMSLQEAVDLKFGVREWEESEYLFVCKRPNVVRVHYYNNPDQPCRSFEELRTFDMPFTRVEGTSLVPDGRCRYALIAVVRLRGSGFGEVDYVRLYRVDGCNINIRSNNPAFSTSRWSVGSPSPHLYAMFFGRADDVQLEAYPEVSPIAAETGDIEGLDI